MMFFKAIEAYLKMEPVFGEVCQFCQVFFDKKAVGQDYNMDLLVHEQFADYFRKPRIDKRFPPGEIEQFTAQVSGFL